MVRLITLATGEEPEDVPRAWLPICSDKATFDGRIKELRRNPHLAGWLARIEELQPYNAGNPSIWGWSNTGREAFPLLPYGLDRLTKLDNIDKHRCILRPWNGPKFWGGSLNAPPEFRSAGGSRPEDPLIEGAEIGRVWYQTPLPSEWVPDQVDMKRNFPFDIVQRPSPDKSVIRILAWCLWSARATLQIFEPVFTQGKPPLLVTESLPPPPEASTAANSQRSN